MTIRYYLALLAVPILASCDRPGPSELGTPTSILGTCQECGLDLEGTFELQDHPDFPVGLPADVTYRSGRYYVVFSDTPTRIIAYDSSGVPQFAWGREGQGPGEVRVIQSVNWVGDSLHVLDGANSRHLVLDTALQVVKETRIEIRPGTRSGAVVDGDLLVAGRLLAPGNDTGLHVIGDNGMVQESFFPLGSHRLGHILWAEPLPGGDLLVGRYWDGSLSLVRRGEEDSSQLLLERPPWFEPVAPARPQGVSEGGPLPEPHAALRDIAVEAPAVAWTLSQTPRSDWRERAAGDDRPPPDARVGAVVEAISLTTGDVLGHLELWGFPAQFARPGEVVLYNTSSAGLPSVTVVRLRLAAEVP